MEDQVCALCCNQASNDEPEELTPCCNKKCHKQCSEDCYIYLNWCPLCRVKNEEFRLHIEWDRLENTKYKINLFSTIKDKIVPNKSQIITFRFSQDGSLYGLLQYQINRYKDLVEVINNFLEDDSDSR